MVSFVPFSLRAQSSSSEPPRKKVKFNLSSQQSAPISIKPKFPFPGAAKQDLKNKNITVIENTTTVKPIFSRKNQDGNSHERPVRAAQTAFKSGKREEDWSEMLVLFIPEKEKEESSEKETYSQKSGDALKDIDMSEGSYENKMTLSERAREEKFRELEEEDLDFSFSNSPSEMHFLLENDRLS